MFKAAHLFILKVFFVKIQLHLLITPDMFTIEKVQITTDIKMT